MKLNLISVLWTLAALMAAPCVLAEKADRNKPMNIEADALRHDDPQKLTTFTGNVMMSKGSTPRRALYWTLVCAMPQVWRCGVEVWGM